MVAAKLYFEFNHDRDKSTISGRDPPQIQAMATKSPKVNANNQSKPNETSNEVPSTFVDTHGVIISTMNDLPGYRIVKVLGTIYGITVRARNWGADLGAFLKSAVGGEIRFFTTLMYSSRNSAVERLVGECLQKGGNAIIAMRFDQGEVKDLFMMLITALMLKFR